MDNWISWKEIFIDYQNMYVGILHAYIETFPN